MFIHWLEFENHTTGQKINRIHFNRLNLMVGVSGAGKTQILKALSTYVGAVVTGESIPCAGRLAMCFSVDSISEKKNIAAYENLTWVIETKKQFYKSDGNSGYEIANESLSRSDGNNVFVRTERVLHVEGKEMPRIALDKSVLNVFLPDIQASFFKVASLFRQIKGVEDVPRDYAEEQIKLWEVNQYGGLPLAEIKKRLSQYPILLSIFLAKKYVPGLYRDFLDALQASFPYVKEVLASDKAGQGKSELAIWQDHTWVSKSDISGGTMKAIYVLSTLFFWTDGSVILLDELENALGVNCLDNIVEHICIKSAENHQQFILTSHHPYIINRIPVNHWHIISQTHGVIDSKYAKEVDIGREYNKQELFFQLLNYLRG